MPPSLTITLDIAPVPFSRPRFNKGRGFNAPKYASFKAKAGWLMRAKFRKPAHLTPIGVHMIFAIVRPPTIKRPYPSVKPDGDNLVKAIFDAGNKILWEDDALIVFHSALKIYADKPTITIEISEFDRVVEKRNGVWYVD